MDENLRPHHLCILLTAWAADGLGTGAAQEDDVAQDVEQDRAQDYGFKMEL